jgi:hypothetical protein
MSEPIRLLIEEAELSSDSYDSKEIWPTRCAMWSWVLHSSQEALEMRRNLAKSASLPRSDPSAIFDAMDTADLVI